MRPLISPLDAEAPETAETVHKQVGPLCAERIFTNPKFARELAKLALDLRAQFISGPRVARTLASHQRWLITQCGFALHLEYDPQDKNSGLTVGRLRDLVTASGAASRNTVLNHIEEMRSYRFVRDVAKPGAGRTRRRRMEATELAIEAMQAWFHYNIAMLDRLDDGNRVEQNRADPDIFRIAQPLTARACIADPVWLEPTPTIGLFQWTEGGALVMDELVARTGDAVPDDEGRYRVGTLNIRAMSDHFMMSHTHLQRLFRKAAEVGVVGWIGPRRKAELWLSADFLTEYRRWQSVKLGHLAAAFEQAVAERGLATG